MEIKKEVEQIADDIFNLSETIDHYSMTNSERITSAMRINLKEKIAELEGNLSEINFKLDEKFKNAKDEAEETEIKKIYRHAKSAAKILLKSKSDLEELNSYKAATFYNLKGGVAKTTLTYLAAIELSERGRKVLVVDLDPQGNVTTFFDSEENPIDILGTENVMVHLSPPHEVICKTNFKNVDIIGTDIDLIQTELDLHSRKTSRDVILKTWFKENREFLNENYDNIFFDLSPSFSFLNVNGFVVAEGIIYVANPSKSTIKGIRGFKKYYLDLIENAVDKDKKYSFVVNKIQERRTISDNFLAEVKKIKNLQSIRVSTDIHQAEAIKKAVETGTKLSKKDHERSYKEVVYVIDDLCERGIL